MTRPPGAEGGIPLRNASPDVRVALLEIGALWLVTLLAIRGAVMAQRAGLPDWTLAAVPFLFVYAPVLACRLRGADAGRYPLELPAWRDAAAWRDALRLNAAWIAVILVPWLVGYHLWQNLFAWMVAGWPARHWDPATLDWTTRVLPRAILPHDAWLLVPYHLFFVALPEEFFYRGYVQTRLDEVFPARWTWLGVRVGWGLPLACLLFAFGHSLVEVRWWHFATFFPGLVFGWMRARTGQPLAGALFHAWCNVVVVLLDTAYGVRPP